MERFLTTGEQKLLNPIFQNTFPYSDQLITQNTREWGGAGNSITPDYEPQFAASVWNDDFSRADNGDKWIFIHEMTHAWQWYHGRNNIMSAVKVWLRYDDYEDAYDYNLDLSNNLFDFNFEQQASIVPDYWFVKNGLIPKHNKGMRAREQDYMPYMLELWQAGPPERKGYVDRAHEYRYRTMM